jgi:antitoxin (DNA-binding transcriptional repressor) of toxin-antitoxin stability system
METVTLAHAKEHLEDLIARARRGEDVRIADPHYGSVRLTQVPVPDVTAARVLDTMPPFVPLAQDRVPGRLAGKMVVPARLMEPMSEDELRDWYRDDA